MEVQSEQQLQMILGNLWQFSKRACAVTMSLNFVKSYRSRMLFECGIALECYFEKNNQNRILYCLMNPRTGHITSSMTNSSFKLKCVLPR